VSRVDGFETNLALHNARHNGRARSLKPGFTGEFERSLSQERTQADFTAVPRLGRTGGRPPKFTDDDVEAAKAMLALANPDIAVTQIVQRLGISPATLSQEAPETQKHGWAAKIIPKPAPLASTAPENA
jgi:hypothetical protein